MFQKINVYLIWNLLLKIMYSIKNKLVYTFKIEFYMKTISIKALLIPFCFALFLAFAACESTSEGSSKEPTEEADSLKKQKEAEDMEDLIIPIMKTL